jgi:hypothetical protein
MTNGSNDVDGDQSRYSQALIPYAEDMMLKSVILGQFAAHRCAVNPFGNKLVFGRMLG